eukprot:scaffold618_cov372-Prasinococcus_capsulatus_cf.AAC.2
MRPEATGSRGPLALGLHVAARRRTGSRVRSAADAGLAQTKRACPAPNPRAEGPRSPLSGTPRPISSPPEEPEHRTERCSAASSVHACRRRDPPLRHGQCIEWLAWVLGAGLGPR